LNVKLAQDGIIERDSTEFETFPRYVTRKNAALQVSIPLPVATKLSLSEGSLVQVAVKKISEDECQSLFLHLPRRYPINTRQKQKPVIYETKKYLQSSRRYSKSVICPVCGKEGVLWSSIVTQCYFAKKGKTEHTYISVRVSHNTPDAILVHCVSRKRYPEFFAENVDRKEDQS